MDVRKNRNARMFGGSLGLPRQIHTTLEREFLCPAPRHLGPSDGGVTLYRRGDRLACQSCMEIWTGRPGLCPWAGPLLSRLAGCAATECVSTRAATCGD